MKIINLKTPKANAYRKEEEMVNSYQPDSNIRYFFGVIVIVLVAATIPIIVGYLLGSVR